MQSNEKKKVKHYKKVELTCQLDWVDLVELS